MSTTYDFSGAKDVGVIWQQCNTRSVSSGLDKDTASLHEVALGVEKAIGDIQTCGLANDCLQLVQTTELAALSKKQRRDFFEKVKSKRWFQKGLQSYQAELKKDRWHWVLKGTPRTQARVFLRQYLAPLLDTNEYTLFLTNLAEGEAEFNLSLNPILDLPYLSSRELADLSELPFFLKQDGRAIEQAHRIIVRAEEEKNYGLGIVTLGKTRTVTSPLGQFVYDLLPSLEIELLLLYLYLFALGEPGHRRQARSVVAQAVAQTYGLACLAGVPVRLLYENTHGSAVIEEILPALSRSADDAAAQSEDTLSLLEHHLGKTAKSILERLWKRLLTIQHNNVCSLLRSAVTVSKDRIQIGPDLVPNQTVTVSLSSKSVEVYTQPNIVIHNYEGNEEIYWLERTVWEHFLAAALLINQSLITVIVTAACNRWGGKHPPHVTHQSGIEVDIDWGYVDPITGKSAIVPDLQKKKKEQSPRGKYYDPRTGKFFDLTPDPVRKGAATQYGYDALASWIVFQGLALLGFTRLLYADDENMAEAFAHLANGLSGFAPPTVWPLEIDSLGSYRDRPKSAKEALVEPVVHYNHLHAEYKGATFDANNAFKINEEILVRLYELAQTRDNDSAFRLRFFGEKSSPYAEKWFNASTEDRPHLLPVWSP